ncbi:hypothetical protein D3C83_136300 [compost metagenome]
MGAPANVVQQVDAAAFRHPDIQDGNIGFHFLDQLPRLRRVFCLLDRFDAVEIV